MDEGQTHPWLRNTAIYKRTKKNEKPTQIRDGSTSKNTRGRDGGNNRRSIHRDK